MNNTKTKTLKSTNSLLYTPNTKHLKTSIILTCVLIVSTILGIIFDCISGVGIVAFLYFTVQSNIWIMIISIIYMIYQIKFFKNGLINIPNWIYNFKFMATVAISLTFLIFTFVLAPLIIKDGRIDELFSINNFCLHEVTPILSIINFSLFDSNYKFKKNTKFLGLILPIYYFIFSILLKVFSGKPYFISANNTYSKFPYFFLDYETFGWFTLNKGIKHLGVFYWIIFISLLILGIGFILLKLQKFNHNKYYSKQKI